MTYLASSFEVVLPTTLLCTSCLLLNIRWNNRIKMANIIMMISQAASHKSYPWEYWAREEGRSECGHVGLLNLGATCYMATAVQQLFMIPATRACILQGDGLGPTDPTFGKHLSTLYELRR